MEVVQLTNYKWLFMEELQAVICNILMTNLLGGSLASDDLYLLDLRNGD